MICCPYNLQGDVIALADGQTGKLAATYTYDAWGKCTVTNATGFTIGTLNPFRYRGYYYDTETSLYYLLTRYYDPEVGRFVNADAFTSTDISSPLSANMFAYCENRPTVGSDPTGEWVHIAVGAIVGGIVGGIEAAHNGENVLSKVLTGALGGALSMSGAGFAAQVAGAAALAAVDNTVKQLTSAPASSFSIDSLISDTVTGGVFGAVGGRGASYTNAKSIMGYGKQVVKQIKGNIKHGRSVFKPIKNYLGRAHVKGHHSVFTEFSAGLLRSKTYSHVKGHWSGIVNGVKDTWNRIFK